MNKDISQAIIRTIAFYDAVGNVPLTKIELYKYLLTGSNNTHISFYEFLESLESNWDELAKHITHYRGFYFLKKNPYGYARRINIGKTNVKKWRIAKKMTEIISLLPFVRMVAVTGSLALDNTNPKSDIDVLIVAKNGYIWTTRMLVSATMQILGTRRYGQKIADRICLNHYITDANLALRPKHLFSAHICATLIPLWSKNHTVENFFFCNQQLIEANLQNFWDLPRGSGIAVGSPVSTVKSACMDRMADIVRLNQFYAISSLVEAIIAKTIGKKLEAAVKAIQIKKIRGNIASGKAGEGEIIFDDQALVFHHPRPKKQEAMYLYEKNLEELGMNK